MIRITKGQANNVSVTLSEKTTITPVYYYLEVKSNQDRSTSKAVYMGVDASTNINRYNEFTITEDDVEDLDNSVISLDAGSYDYYAWECSTQSFTNKVSIVESGKLVVEGTVTPTTTFNDTPTEYTFNG